MPGSHTLHMIVTDPAKRIHATKAVRSARTILGDTYGAGLRQSLEAVDASRSEPEVPVLIGRSADLSRIQEAANALEEGYCRPLIDLTPEQVFNADLTPSQQVRSTDSEPEYGHEAYATALTLMAMTEGNPNSALIAANALMRCTGDAEFFDEVGDVLLAVFFQDSGE